MGCTAASTWNTLQSGVRPIRLDSPTPKMYHTQGCIRELRDRLNRMCNRCVVKSEHRITQHAFVKLPTLGQQLYTAAPCEGNASAESRPCGGRGINLGPRRAGSSACMRCTSQGKEKENKMKRKLAWEAGVFLVLCLGGPSGSHQAEC